MTNEELLQQLEELNQIGIALSKEKNIDLLLEQILLAAKKLANADAGTLYIVEEDRDDEDEQKVTFKILLNDTLNTHLGGSSGKPITFPQIRLYNPDGSANLSLVVAYSVINDETVNIPDVYHAEGFDFNGTKNFDKHSGYRSQSFLTIPIHDHENAVIAVIQLINAKDRDTGEVIPFSATSQSIVESLSSQAGVALTNRSLMRQQEELFEGFIKLINNAIDTKSKHTGKHCQLVPALTMMIAEAVHERRYEGFHMNDDDRYELRIAGMLHDCGKITTPVHVIDKSTKLETIIDRIHMIDTRFEIIRRDAEILLLRNKITQAEYDAFIAKLNDDQEFVRRHNQGKEFMADEHKERIKEISQYQYFTNDKDDPVNLLNDDEIYNLCISRGTLTAEERDIINMHIVSTIAMLESLPWPKNLRRVSEYAGGHHERMDGKGYPKGLTRNEMSIQARVMAIADIFEALTSSERPYKKPNTLSESLFIMGKMQQEGHIDPDLFEIFVREKVYLKYAEQYLLPSQIDEVNFDKIPGLKTVDA